MNLYEYARGQVTRASDPYGLTVYTNEYSRGYRHRPLNAGDQDQFETAKIAVSLDVNNSACRRGLCPGCKGKCPGCGMNLFCLGDVKLKFSYKATMSTNWADIAAQGPNWGVRVRGEQTGVNFDYTIAAANKDMPKQTIGNTLTASLDLGTIPCDGGKNSGKLDVQPRRRGTNNWVPGVEQTITWKVEIGSCGVIKDADIKLESFDPIQGRDPKLRNPGVRLIKSSYLPKDQWEQPYPPLRH